MRRELAFNHARYSDDPAGLDTLPDWALETMRKHARDPRTTRYDRDQLERCETYDPLWNATLKEMLLRGTIHGYYRMYWGKKIVEWSPTYQEAADAMVYRWTAGIRTSTRTSCGAWACTTVRGRSGRYSASYVR